MRQKPLTIAGLRIPPGDITSSCVPAMNGLRLQKIVPPTWNSGRLAVSTSLARILPISAPPSAETSWLRWVCATSLGVPVVPPVWK